MCDGCKKGGKVYPCTIGGTSSLCSDCYATKLRGELMTAGYSKAWLESRLKTLLGNPDSLEQWKGVCGFVSCIHEILNRKSQIQDLFEATFHDLEPTYDPTFVMADGSSSSIPFVELIGRVSTATNAVKSGYFLDWCLCRGLMHLLHVKDSSRYNREVDFSNLFNIPSWDEEGHFAMQTDSLAYVARTILGMKVLWILKQDYAPTVKVKRESTDRLTQQTGALDVDPVNPRSPKSVAEAGLHMAREAVFLLDGSVAMFTGLRAGHMSGWSNQSIDDKTINSRLTGKLTDDSWKLKDLPFSHWVVINKATLSTDKKSVTFSLWSWHTRREITYPVEFLTMYFKEAIFVKL